jgi:hypothetical protein
MTTTPVNTLLAQWAKCLCAVALNVLAGSLGAASEQRRGEPAATRALQGRTSASESRLATVMGRQRKSEAPPDELCPPFGVDPFSYAASLLVTVWGRSNDCGANYRS